MRTLPIGRQNKTLVFLIVSISSITLFACGFLFDGGIRRSSTPIPSAAGTYLFSEKTEDVPSEFTVVVYEARNLHRSGQHSKSIPLYVEALETLPDDDDYNAIRANVYISKGEAHLMMGGGKSAREAGLDADKLLTQATPLEKRSPEWKLMMAKTMTISAAGLLIEVADSGLQPVDEYVQLLQGVTEIMDLPEIHFFSGLGYAKAERVAEAKREFELFLNSDSQATFISSDKMNELALKVTSLPESGAYPDPLDEALTEHFWLAVEVAGMPRTTPFGEAKRGLSTDLLEEIFELQDLFRQIGIDPVVEWPYCKKTIKGSFAIVDLPLSRSPAEAGSITSEAIDSIMRLEEDWNLLSDLILIGEYPDKSGTYQLCEIFEDEERVARGWPARKQ